MQRSIGRRPAIARRVGGREGKAGWLLTQGAHPSATGRGACLRINPYSATLHPGSLAGLPAEERRSTGVSCHVGLVPTRVIFDTDESSEFVGEPRGTPANAEFQPDHRPGQVPLAEPN